MTSDQDLYTKLGSKRFKVLESIESHMQDLNNELVSQLTSQNQTDKLNESGLNNPACLVSLKDILERKIPVKNTASRDGEMRVEVYEMM